MGNKTGEKKLVLLFSTTFMEMALNGTMLLVITRSQLFAKMQKAISNSLVVLSQTSKFHRKEIIRCTKKRYLCNKTISYLFGQLILVSTTKIIIYLYCLRTHRCKLSISV